MFSNRLLQSSLRRHLIPLSLSCPRILSILSSIKSVGLDGHGQLCEVSSKPFLMHPKHSKSSPNRKTRSKSSSTSARQPSHTSISSLFLTFMKYPDWEAAKDAVEVRAIPRAARWCARILRGQSPAENGEPSLGWIQGNDCCKLANDRETFTPAEISCPTIPTVTNRVFPRDTVTKKSPNP